MYKIVEYSSYDGWLHRTTYWVGASETQLLSEERKKDDIFRPIRRWKLYEEPEPKPEVENWLSRELQRARENGDLDET